MFLELELELVESKKTRYLTSSETGTGSPRAAPYKPGYKKGSRKYGDLALLTPALRR